MAVVEEGKGGDTENMINEMKGTGVERTNTVSYCYRYPRVSAIE